VNQGPSPRLTLDAPGLGDAPGPEGTGAGPDISAAVMDRSQKATWSPLVTRSVALNDPPNTYVWRGWGCVDAPSSPKRQSKA